MATIGRAGPIQSHELPLSLPCGSKSPKDLGHFLLPFQVTNRKLDWKWGSKYLNQCPKGSQCYRQRLIRAHPRTSPFLNFCKFVNLFQRWIYWIWLPYQSISMTTTVNINLGWFYVKLIILQQYFSISGLQTPVLELPMMVVIHVDSWVLLQMCEISACEKGAQYFKVPHWHMCIAMFETYWNTRCNQPVPISFCHLNHWIFLTRKHLKLYLRSWLSWFCIHSITLWTRYLPTLETPINKAEMFEAWN